MRIGENLAGVQAGAARYAGPSQDGHHVVLRSLLRPRLDHRVLHGNLDALAEAGAMALHQRGEDADDAVHAGARVADRRPRVRRRTVREAGDAHGPAHRLRDRLVALVLAVRPPRAEALDARVHQAWIELTHRRVVEAEALDHAGT